MTTVNQQESNMVYRAAIFLNSVIIAGIYGFRGIAGTGFSFMAVTGSKMNLNHYPER
jgi:hypothetical protein